MAHSVLSPSPIYQVFLIQLYHLLTSPPHSFPNTQSQNPLWGPETIRKTYACRLTVETPAHHLGAFWECVTPQNVCPTLLESTSKLALGPVAVTPHHTIIPIYEEVVPSR